MAKKNRIENTGTETAGAPKLDANGQPVPPETKAGRYLRLVKKRVPRAIKAINAVANLSATGQYGYTQEQAAKVIGVLENALNVLRLRFSGRKPEQEGLDLD